MKQESLFIFLIIGLPIVIFFILLFIANRAFKKSQGHYVVIQLGNSSVLTPKKTVKRFLIFGLFIYYLDSFLPIPFFSLYLPLSIFFLTKVKISSGSIVTQHNSLIDNLQSSLKAIQDSIYHIESLSIDLETKQKELGQKEKYSKEIEEKITKQIEDYARLKDVTEEDRKQLIAALREGNKKTPMITLGVIIGSISLNVIASALWALAGNPSKKDMIDYLKGLLHL